MPYAQSHYPFENKRVFESTFPADFIAEGINIYCSMFHSSYIGMNVCGSAYENGCVVNGMCASYGSSRLSIIYF